MSETLMQLGAFQFSVDYVSYQSLKRSQSYRWSSQARISRRPAQQFVGVGEEKVDFTGTIYPRSAREIDAMTTLRGLAEQGTPQQLTDGAGLIWGQWVILSLDETQTIFIGNGWPKKITFQIHLKRYGEDG